MIHESDKTKYQTLYILNIKPHKNETQGKISSRRSNIIFLNFSPMNLPSLLVSDLDAINRENIYKYVDFLDFA